MKKELDNTEIIYMLEIICDSLEHGDNWGIEKRKVTIMLIKKVITALEARSQKPEARSQKPEARSQKPEARSQKPEARSQKPEARSQKPEARSQKPKE